MSDLRDKAYLAQDKKCGPTWAEKVALIIALISICASGEVRKLISDFAQAVQAAICQCGPKDASKTGRASKRNGKGGSKKKRREKSSTASLSSNAAGTPAVPVESEMCLDPLSNTEGAASPNNDKSHSPDRPLRPDEEPEEQKPEEEVHLPGYFVLDFVKKLPTFSLWSLPQQNTIAA